MENTWGVFSYGGFIGCPDNFLDVVGRSREAETKVADRDVFLDRAFVPAQE